MPYSQIRCLLWMFSWSFFFLSFFSLCQRRFRSFGFNERKKREKKNFQNFHVDCEACMSLNATEIALVKFNFYFIYCIFSTITLFFSQQIWRFIVPNHANSQQKSPFPAWLRIAFCFVCLDPTNVSCRKPQQIFFMNTSSIHTLMFTPKTGICGNCLHHK